MQMQVFDHRGPLYGIQDLVKAVQHLFIILYSVDGSKLEMKC